MTSPCDESKALSSHGEFDEEVNYGSGDTSDHEEEEVVLNIFMPEPKSRPAPNPFVEHSDVHAIGAHYETAR